MGCPELFWRISQQTACLRAAIAVSHRQKSPPRPEGVTVTRDRPRLRCSAWSLARGPCSKQQIGFYASLNPDCSAAGDVNVRVTKQPEHGTVETVARTDYVHYAKENIRSKCNQHRVKGALVNYKAAEKYTGNDEFDLLILYPTGFARELHYDISVR
jgi:hypothetical protein